MHMRGNFLRVWLSVWAVGSAHAETPWLEVPYIEQEESTGCGSASIAMVMQYWMHQGANVEPAVADAPLIYAKLSTSSRSGISGQALKGYLEGHGFSAYVFDGNLDEVRSHLGKGRPLVVCLDPKSGSSLLHYVVVVGIDDSAVYFHDPARGKLLKLEFKRFQREWKATGSWILLAVPLGGK